MTEAVKAYAVAGPETLEEKYHEMRHAVDPSAFYGDGWGDE